MDEKSREPEQSPEDQIISSYLKERSLTYRDLREISTIVWNDPEAKAFFARERASADHPNDRSREEHYNLMRIIGDEMQRQTRALELQRPRNEVLDLCMAPGGYTASVRKYGPQANISAIPLPEDQGGLRILVPHGNGTRVKVLEADITMFAAEFGVTDIPDKHPEASNFSNEQPFQQRFNLVFCNGHVARTQHVPSYLREGGTLIISLHGADVYHNVKPLKFFDGISHIQLFKPVKAHTRKTSFYLVAKDLQPGRAVARAGVIKWKRIWKYATFPAPADDRTLAHDEAVVLLKQIERENDSSELVESFGGRLVELGEPIWEIQKKALKALIERLERESPVWLRGMVEPSGKGANAESATLGRLTRDINDSSQLEASVADTLEEGDSVDAEVVGGQQQENRHEDAYSEDKHATVGLIGSEQASNDSAQSAGAEVSDETRVLPVEVGKSSLGSDDVSAAFGGLELDH